MAQWLIHQVCPCGGFSGCFLPCEPGPLRRLDTDAAEELYITRAIEGRGFCWLVLPNFHPHGLDCVLQDVAGQAVAMPLTALENALVPAYLAAPTVKAVRAMLPLGLERLVLPVVPLSPSLQAEYWI